MKIKRFIPYIIAFAAVLAAELTVFNIPFYISAFSGLSEKNYAASEILVGGEPAPGDSIRLSDCSGSFIEIKDINTKSKYIKINTNSADETAEFEVRMSDKACSNGYRNIGDFKLYGKNEKSKILAVKSHGNLEKLNLLVISACKELEIESITLNYKIPFDFSAVRFILLILISFFIIYSCRKKAFSKIFSRSSESQNRVFLCVLILCMLFSAFIGILTATKPESYPLKDISNADSYAQQFDAFLKGRLSLDIEPSESLLNNEYPYDVSTRNNIDNYPLDRAYYNGKLYSYYGVAPIFVFYYPYYFITKTIPSPGLTGLFFTEIFIIAFFFLMREIIAKTAPKCNYMIYIFGMVASLFSSFIFVAQSSADMYYLPVISAFAFTALFWLAAIKASSCEKRSGRIIWLSVAALFAVLILASKPTYTLLCFAAIPIFIKMLLKKENKILCNAAEFLPCIAVLFGGIFAVLFFNYLRFDSFFEFGTKYQLTVVDANFSNITAEGFFRTIYYYFFEMPAVKAEFPYLVPYRFSVGYFPNYVYQAVNIGAFTIPMLLASLFIGSAIKKEDGAYEKASLLILSATAILISFVDYSFGGIHLRYTMDILLPLSVLSMIIICKISQNNCNGEHKGVSKYMLAAMIISVIFGFLYVFSNERNYIEAISPDVYYNIAGIFNIFR